ncbi:MAG: lysostaphin resistance A-like protein [Planctomycetia bacterium]|nr:lysostaphin resistance A-like protein [Planctomycetia bacterium]
MLWAERGKEQSQQSGPAKDEAICTPHLGPNRMRLPHVSDKSVPLPPAGGCGMFGAVSMRAAQIDGMSTAAPVFADKQLFGERMKGTARLKLISTAAPYVAVLIGLYILKNAWIAIGLYHCGITVFLIANDKNNLLRKVYTGWNSMMAVASMVMSAMIFPLVFFFWGHMQLENVSLTSALADLGLHGTSWFFFAIYFSTVQPLLEEMYWRGYLECKQKYFSWTDLAFAGYHILVLAWFIKLPWLAIAFVALTATAYIWRYIASRLKGLAVPLLSHVVADVTIIAVTYVLIQ